MPAKNLGTAMIIGGGITGLVTAHVLSEQFDHVVVLERDVLGEGVGHRPGTPQARHLHQLHLKGKQHLERIFPGIFEDMQRDGSVPIDLAQDQHWLTPVGWVQRFPSHFTLYTATRPLLEHHIRQRVLSLPNVTIRPSVDVHGLVFNTERTQVQGVRCRRRSSEHHVSETLAADLVVDASGRRSRLASWLEDAGFSVPDETTINAHVCYATRFFERPSNHPASHAFVLQTSYPGSGRSGVLLPVEKDQWVVTLVGIAGDQPPTDEQGFLEFARSLRSPEIYERIQMAKPVSQIMGYQQTENHRRHYERVRRWPGGLVALGDAVCALNPIYGQGMTVAIQSALLLGNYVAHYPALATHGTLAHRFQRALARSYFWPWMLATTEDRQYPTTKGANPSLLSAFALWYMKKVLRLAMQDEGVHQTVLEVIGQVRTPVALGHPVIALRCVFALLRQKQHLIPDKEKVFLTARK